MRWTIAALVFTVCGGLMTESEPVFMQRLASESPLQVEFVLVFKGPISSVGTYRSKHTIRVVCEDPDWCEQEVTDSLTISFGDDGAFHVEVELVQANAHICNFEDIFMRVDDRRWQWIASEGEPRCILVLDWRATSIDLSPDGCREFCGGMGDT